MEGSQKHLLVVEDTQGVRDLIEARMSREGYKVSTAEDGVDGYKIYMALRPEIDCVITDLEMPRMWGNELMKRIRAVDPEMKVILISGNLHLAMIDEVVPSAQFEKPIRFDDLFEEIRKLIGP